MKELVGILKPNQFNFKNLDINDEYFIENSLITIDHVEKITLIYSETPILNKFNLNFENGKKIWEEQSDMFKGKFRFCFDNQVITIVYITKTSGRVSFFY